MDIHVAPGEHVDRTPHRRRHRRYQKFLRLSDEQQYTLFSQLDTLESRFGVLLIDTATGISSDIMYFSITYFSITANDNRVMMTSELMSFLRPIRCQNHLLTQPDPHCTSAPCVQPLPRDLTNIPNDMPTQNDTPDYWQQRLIGSDDQPAASHCQSAQAVL